MIKRNKWNLIFSSVVIVSPMLFGLIAWNILPDRLAVHWGVDGEADGFAGKLFAVLFLPLFLLAMHWVCVLITAADHKHREQSPKVYTMVLWIMPVISVVMNSLTYAVALGWTANINWILCLLFGVGLMLIGNYLPKCKQNRTVGIKISWTLASEKNWNATHRLAGKVWFFSGIVMTLGVFLPFAWSMALVLSVLVVVVAVPCIYSYRYFKKQVAAGEVSPEQVGEQKKVNRAVLIVTAVLLATMGIAFGVLMFTGEVWVSFTEQSFTVDSTYDKPQTLQYTDIDRVEYREQDDPGQRVMGFGSATLLLGTFENEEFGRYTRYSYTKATSCVVIRADGKVLVIGLESYEQTKAFYDDLAKHVGED